VGEEKRKERGIAVRENEWRRMKSVFNNKFKKSEFYGPVRELILSKKPSLSL
jgi:hypothetical protein